MDNIIVPSALFCITSTTASCLQTGMHVVVLVIA